MFVSLTDGNSIQKSESGKSVTCLQDANVKQILPLLTQPFVFKNSRTLVPRWEELLLFNESFSYLRGLGDKLGIFFLIQDFVSMSKVGCKIGFSAQMS